MSIAPIIVCAALLQSPPAAHVPKAPPDVKQPASATAPGSQAERHERAADERQSPPASGAAEPAGDGALVRVAPHVRQTSAADIIDAALKVSEGSKVRGRSVALLEVLRSVSDRNAQFRATESYWTLAGALADYHFTWDELQQLERLKPAGAAGQALRPEQQMLATRLAAANARMQDAELALVAAQYDLAAAMRLPAGQPLPLPADVPHVGPYRTVLDQLYLGRVPPTRAVLIDRTLPLRHGAIDARAAAIQAATDALDATEEAHHSGTADLTLVLSLIDELSRQRRALLVEVRTYNNDIAEYAMTAPLPSMEAQGLASMLIKPSAGAQPSAVAGGTVTSPGLSGGVERAGFNQPITTSPAGPLVPVPEGYVPLAPPPGFVAPNAQNQPTLAPPKPAQQPAKREPTLAPPRNGGTNPATGVDKTAPKSADGWQSQTARKPAHGAEAVHETVAPEHEMAPHDATATTSAPAAVAAPHSLYPALYGMASDGQARQLAQILCWAPAATADMAPITLAEFLAAVPTARRVDAIAAYWQAQYQAARTAVLEQQTEQFAALAATFVSQPFETPDSTAPSAMLLVRTAQLAAEADMRRAQADRLAAQWALTNAVGRPLTGRWLAASTSPHAGGYKLQLDVLSRELRESAIVERLSVTIPQFHRAVAERAAAVVTADKARGMIEVEPADALASTERALEAIREQTDQTMTFLARLTDYNIEIAVYATAVLPPATSSQSLVRALVTATADAGR